MKSIFSVVFSIILFFSFSNDILAQSPATEIRAVWLTTNWNLDWPSAGKSIENQQKELSKILDQLQEANFNTVLFQVRIRGDVFYRSNIEPLSPFFQKNINTGSSVPYDPLSYAIQECHKRGMDCHAWFVTFPVGSQKQVAAQGSSSIVKKQPQICKLHQGEWYLDPGNPRAQQYILSLVNEIVTNYDIDGIHFDYIRYPENAKKFPDNDTFKKYSQGESLQEWRRKNINNLVTQIYDQVKAEKPWVQVSSSPLGRYKNLDPMRGTWTAYESVHQDAGLWMQEGKMDAVYPMMYYNEANFGSYVEEWKKNSNGRFVAPGLGVYRLLKNEGDWDVKDITDQMNYIRDNHVAGASFYRAGNVLDNVKGIKNTLVSNYYKYPAKIPPMTWLDNVGPNSPLNMQVYNEGDYIVIEWEASERSEEQTYTVYESSTSNFDILNAQSIIMTGIHGNKIYMNRDEEDHGGIYYSVTASDRFHNESVPCFPTFFILSSNLAK